MRRSMLVLATVAILVGGCFTTDLDPGQVGAFACTDEPEGECPDGLSCVNGRCETEDALPTVEIGFPEDEQDIGLGEIPIGGLRTVTINMSGTLDLVAEGGDHVFGEGHLEVTVDDQPPITVDSGALSGIVSLDVQLANIVGAHRIGVQAIRNDGKPYDHADGFATRLFWISDGMTPLVGIKSPWPGTAFPLDATPIQVDAAVLTFTLQAANPLGVPVTNTGHIHVYYAKDIDTCIADAECDNEYLTTIIAQGVPGELTIPDSSAGEFPLTLVLRNINHALFTFDATPDDGVDNPLPVIDEVQLVRD